MTIRVAAAVTLAFSAWSFGQIVPSAAPRPAFEVATIKRSDSKEMRMMIRPRGDRLTVTNVPLQLLLTLVYKIRNFQISGAPGWMQSERYDLEAKADRKPTSIDDFFPMVQSLFEDRLQLKFHRESKQGDIYALVVSKPGKLHESAGECGPPPEGPPPPPEPGKLPKTFCGGFFGFPGHLTGKKITIAQLLEPLSNSVGQIVVDKTGLTGKYDIDLEYTPDPGQFGAPGGPAPPGAPPGAMPFPAPDPNGPSLFTALQEQLGLKLESQKGPVEMFVIDHVERPSEN